MIAACPKCSARYRIDREKLQGGAVRLRCTKCEAVFRVRAPEDTPIPASPSPAEVAAPAPVSPAPAQALHADGAQQPNDGQARTQADRDAVGAQRGEAERSRTQADRDAVGAQRGEAERSRTQADRDAVGAQRAEGERSRTQEPLPPLPENAPAVLIAIPEAELGKRIGEALQAHGLRAIVVQDGVEAMLETQRQLPVAVLVAADLPKMYGFQVCEVIKRNESLQGTLVVLAGAIHHPDRYRRPPNELYGADGYIEVPDLPDGLLPILRDHGISSATPSPVPSLPLAAAPEAPSAPAPTAPGPSASAPSASAQEAAPAAASIVAPGPAPLEEPAPVPQPAAMAEQAAMPEPVAAPSPAPPPAAPTPSVPGLDDERAKAERLARIIVSDIILYNEEKFARAVQQGNVAQVMDPDLTEGRGLFEERIDERVRVERDYLVEELLRVARLRGME